MTTYRKDGSALVTPVWFRHVGGAFEVVIAEGDIKLQHLRRDPRCALVVFEAVPPFRGVEIRGEAELVECDVRAIRAAIAGRYSGLKTANASPPSGRSLVSCCVSPERAAHGISRPSCRPIAKVEVEHEIPVFIGRLAQRCRRNKGHLPADDGSICDRGRGDIHLS